MDTNNEHVKVGLNEYYDADDGKILENEIASWNSFEHTLRNENRIIFHQMLDDVKIYSQCVEAKGKNFSFESLCMTLIIQQQNMINELFSRISKKEV